uniref:Uncharacterized protein n=3 Tax=Aegilops tauschii subsp. strangulata TaxID=200361 RepID=A0A453SUK5_AEGTS
VTGDAPAPWPGRLCLLPCSLVLLCLLDDARMPRMRPLLSRAPDRWLQRRGHHRRWGRRRASTTVPLSSRDSSDATSPPRRLLTELLTKEDLVAYIASGCKPKENWR